LPRSITHASRVSSSLYFVCCERIS
jgi:hypothetical protein